MANNELQPPFYQELFDGFSSIARERGTRSIEGDSALEAGKDGTLTPTGETSLASHIYYRFRKHAPEPHGRILQYRM